MVQITLLHFIYLIFILLVIVFMIFKKDTSLVCILGIFILGLVATGSVYQSMMGVFNGLAYAIKELLGTILIISIIVAMGNILEKTGVNKEMIRPFLKFIKTPDLAYWIVGLVMMVVSWFFWPSPAVALIGVILAPVAVKAGLPALAVAVSMNLFGHGIALSSDFVIQGAPKLTAGGAGIEVSEVIRASIPLTFVMGFVTTLVAFILIKRDMKKGLLEVYNLQEEEMDKEYWLSLSYRKLFAALIPIAFLLDIVIMKKYNLQGGDATALIGGTALFILMFMLLVSLKTKAIDEVVNYLIEGLQFGFKVFGPVIPIAAFFYLGDEGFLSILGEYLPKNSTGLVNDLGLALSQIVPINKVFGAAALTTVGAITGLDGSGFSGISLAGTVAKIFGTALGKGTATLTALGQQAAIWVGGGTLIPWAVIPVAAICKVSPFDLAKRNLIPVVIGLIVTTVVAMFLI
ncbi:hypothetical protein SAMN05660865_00825 [Caloramator fervidus]|uniref:Transporter n=1 Tax=Caloramator fervidus TaxID=29344 RepID=A0A1H5U8K5_9CLOT|nr:hypothetical protein SAMN05660865_00825 [Caloramator fervidus]